MQRILLFIISLSIAAMTLVSCDYSSPKTTNQIPEVIINSSSAPEASKPTDVPSEPAIAAPEPPEVTSQASAPVIQTSPSVDDSIAIYNAWLDNHDELSSYTLDNQFYQLFDIFGEQYYCFNSDDPSKYWYNILVHVETGELLFMMTSDGEYPATSIESLDDWFNSIYAESPEPADTPPASVIISVDDAIEIYSTWLDEHDEASSYTLDKQYYQTFDMFGEQYYWFNSDDPSKYWYNILVHVETGELLFMMTSDGEYPTTSIEPLLNWYGNTFSFG